MSHFEILLIVALGGIAFGLWMVAAVLHDIRRDVSEIWKRMKPLD